MQKELRYGSRGEWLERKGSTVTVGLTRATMDDIGGVSFISLPEVSSSLCSGEVAVVVESSKAAIDCEAPLSGTVVAINESLVTHPHVLYEHPEDEGWLYRVESIDEKEWEACSHSCTPSER